MEERKEGGRERGKKGGKPNLIISEHGSVFKLSFMCNISERGVA